MIIAVDGPAASGKGSVAMRLAAHFTLPYLDTGLLYRAVGLGVAQAGLDPSDAPEVARFAGTLDFDALDEDALRTAEAGVMASRISGHAQVRQLLLSRQRAFADQPGGAVLDGRDIGTVICPHADAKLFITADVAERGRRRAAQLRERGEDVTDAEMTADLAERDRRDTERATAPMKPADDAHCLDTTRLDRDEAYHSALNLVLMCLRDSSTT